MSDNREIDPAEVKVLVQSINKLITALDKAAQSGNGNITNTNQINYGNIITAWICTVCCVIVALLALFIKLDQIDQGAQIRRVQDHDTILLQYAPEFLKNLIHDSDTRNKK